MDYVIRLRAETLEDDPILLSQVDYRELKPVRLNLVISCKGDKSWYLVTSFKDAEQAVWWYKKRLLIEEMFRDLKSQLGYPRRISRTKSAWLVCYWDFRLPI